MLTYGIPFTHGSDTVTLTLSRHLPFKGEFYGDALFYAFLLSM